MKDAPVVSYRSRLAAIVAAVMITGVALPVVSGVGSASATTNAAFSRIAGADRYETAAKVASTAFPSGAPSVLLANGGASNFADALAGSYLAGRGTAPVLLTALDSLPSATSSALKALGTKTVFILGGTAAVSGGVEQQLRDQGYTVSRVAGPTRYDTAAAVATGPGAGAVGTGPDGAKTAFVASGVSFPDALVAGGLSYAAGFPLLLTPRDSLADQTRSALSSLAIKTVIIPGGTAAVSDAVRTAIEGMGITVNRVAGATRTDTAALLAGFATDKLGFTTSAVNLARGDDPADSLAGGPLSGVTRTPLLLTQNRDVLSGDTARYLRSNANTIAGGAILGGTGAVSQAVQDEATTDVRTAPGPALSSAAATANSKTITVTYSRPVKCSTVDADGSDYSVTAGGSAATISGATCVNPSNGDSPQVAIALAAALPASTAVTVTAKVGADGNTVTDDNNAAETAGDSISTTTSVVPLFSGAAPVGGRATIDVFYNEPVACASVDNGDYTVTVAGASDAVTAVSCSGTSAQTVTLTVQTAPSAGQTVAVTAKAGSDNDTVKDASGAAQPAGDSVSVAATATAVPVFAAGAVNGTTVTVTYNEPINCSTVDSNGSDYTVVRSGAADNPTAASCGSSGISTTVNLTIPTAPSGGDSIAAAAKIGTDHDTVKDQAGAAQPEGNSVSIIVPSFSAVTATAASTTLTVTYNTSIVCATVDTNGSDYTVTRNGAPNLVTAAGCPSGASTSRDVTLTVQVAPANGDTVDVAAKSGLDSDTVRDQVGSQQPVGDHISSTVRTPPSFVSASATGGSTTVTVTYDRPIVCGTVDANGSDFSATVAGQAAVVTAANCSSPTGNPPTSATVTMTLDRAPKSNDVVNITAKQGADGDTVKDANAQQQQMGDTVSATAGTVPQFASASASTGQTSTVQVTYNEPITCSTVDYHDYSVTVNAEAQPRSVAPTGVACTSSPLQNGQVTITFSGTITAGDVVHVTAKQSDIDNNTVADSNGRQQPVGDTVQATVPAAKSTTTPKFAGASYAAAQTIAVDYDKTIVCSTVDAGDYTVTNGTVGPTPQPAVVTGASCPTGSTTSTRVNITVATTLTPSTGATVTAKLGADGDTVKDQDGNQQVAGDTIDVGTPPRFQSASAAGGTGTPLSPGDTLTLTYDRPIRCSTVDTDVSDYTISANGQPITFGSGAGQAPATAQCKTAGATSDTQVTIKFTLPAQNHWVTGQNVTITAKKGTDSDTVRGDAEFLQQPVGDTVQTTVS